MSDQRDYREPSESNRSASPRSGPVRQADERAPLLTPDDPAVTPYSVPAVRAFRTLLVFLLVASVIWFLLLFINTFISIGLIDVRASGFLHMGLTLIGMFELVVTLMFYSVPSEADRVLGYTTAILLALDTLLIAFVPSLRHRNAGWVGIVTLLGTLFTVLTATVADRVVMWGKEHEEVRLTGRYESRRTLGEWFKVMLSGIGKTVILLLVVFMTLSIAIDTYDVLRVEVHGELVPVDDGTHRVHVYCTEAGIDQIEANPVASESSQSSLDGSYHPLDPLARPPGRGRKHRSNVTVVVEGGETSAEEFASWILELHDMNEVGRVCYWDRPGLGLSDNAPSPMSAGSVAESLSEALNATIPDFHNESLVLVSHGVGGIYSRVFAGRHTNQVRAMLLVDSLHEDLFYEQSTPWRGFLLWLRGLVSPLGIQKLFGWIFKHQGPTARIFGSAQRFSGHWSKAMLQQQISARSLTRSDITAANALLPTKLPVAVASSAKSIKNIRRWSEKQRALTKLTANTIEWRVIDGPHELWRSPTGRSELTDLLKDIFEYVL